MELLVYCGQDSVLLMALALGASDSLYVAANPPGSTQISCSHLLK